MQFSLCKLQIKLRKKKLMFRKSVFLLDFYINFHIVFFAFLYDLSKKFQLRLDLGTHWIGLAWVKPSQRDFDSSQTKPENDFLPSEAKPSQQNFFARSSQARQIWVPEVLLRLFLWIVMVFQIIIVIFRKITFYHGQFTNTRDPDQIPIPTNFSTSILSRQCWKFKPQFRFRKLRLGVLTPVVADNLWTRSVFAPSVALRLN